MNNEQIAARLGGIIPPLVTPFNRRGGIDEGGFRANLARYAGAGFSGVLTSGTTGEAAFLTDDERLRLIEIARPLVKAPQILIAGTGLEGTARTLSLSREAVARGADAVLILPPAYYKSAMTPQVLERHFRAIADGVRRPVLIYSIPQCTGFALDAAMLGRLSRHPNIPGMKESSGNLEFVRAIHAKARKGFRLMMGSAAAFRAGFALGATGAVLSQANFEPQICVGAYDALARGDQRSIGDLEKRLAIMIEGITAPFGVAGIKAALELSGYHAGPPRPPLREVSPADRKKIAAALREARAGLAA